MLEGPEHSQEIILKRLPEPIVLVDDLLDSADNRWFLLRLGSMRSQVRSPLALRELIEDVIRREVIAQGVSSSSTRSY